MESRRVNCFCALALLIAAVPGWAETESGDSGESPAPAVPVDEIALELSSPVVRLGIVGWDFQYRTYQGSLPEADDQTGITNVFTIAWPFELSNGWNLQLQMTIPVLGDQPNWKPEWYLDYAEFVLRQIPSLDPAAGELTPGHDHMGDIGLDIGFSKVSEDGFITMWGLSNVMPTSEDLSASRDQWLLGPEFAFGQMTDWGLYGIRAKHLTNIYGEVNNEVEGVDTNETTLELFYTYALGNGWQIESNPTIMYDWEAVSGNEWTLPLGAGASKTVRFGSVPTKFAFDIQYFVLSPDRLGPEWMFRFAITPVFSSKILN